jgi:hypothetical protein
VLKLLKLSIVPVIHDHVVAVLLRAQVVLVVDVDPLLELVGGDQLADILDDEVAFLEILLSKKAPAFGRGALYFQC